LLGKVGYFTTNPRNIEAIVSTNFEGKMLLGDWSSIINRYQIPTICFTLFRLECGISPIYFPPPSDWRVYFCPGWPSCKLVSVCHRRFTLCFVYCLFYIGSLSKFSSNPPVQTIPKKKLLTLRLVEAFPRIATRQVVRIQY